MFLKRQHINEASSGHQPNGYNSNSGAVNKCTFCNSDYFAHRYFPSKMKFFSRPDFKVPNRSSVSKTQYTNGTNSIVLLLCPDQIGPSVR